MGIVKSLFGGSSSKSYNKAFDQVKSQAEPYVQRGQQAMGQAADMLGLGGGGQPAPVNALPQMTGGGTGTAPIMPGAGRMMAGGDSASGMAEPGGAPGGGGFENYLANTGYDWAMDQGTRAITGNAAAQGMLRSGSTLKGIEEYGQNLGKQFFENYLGQLMNMGQMGQRSTGQVAQAGQVSESDSSSGGLGRTIGAGLSAIGLSDARAKDVGPILDILPNGIEIRWFRYKGDDIDRVGVVAQQVQPIMPEAVIEIDGLLHVDYDAILEADHGLEAH